jgi:hypothetical protein
MSKAKTPVKAGERVKVRVLVDGAFGKSGDCVEIDASLLDDAKGEVDPHPDAVKYAEGLKKK